MQIRLLRHATCAIEFGGVQLLLDPMLSPAGAMDPVRNAADQRRIPLVDLPIDAAALAELLAGTDAVLVTHTHRDHWDARAAELIPKDKPILCQPADQARLAGEGFAEVVPVETTLEWRGIQIARTGGQHGKGEIGAQMAPVSGFVLRAPGEPCLYVAGDTIWCEEVADALARYQPDVVVVNAGAAQFLTGGPITMDADDVARVCEALPGGQLLAVHMEAINHCLLTRAGLAEQLAAQGLAERVRIPADGESVEL